MHGGWSRIAGGSIEERADHRDGLGGAFLHEPVAAVGDDSLLNVSGDIAEDDGFVGAEGFFAADGEHGHGERHMSHFRTSSFANCAGQALFLTFCIW
jgi:hypothetical protein